MLKYEPEIDISLLYVTDNRLILSIYNKVLELRNGLTKYNKNERKFSVNL